MNPKITSDHLNRGAIVYVRQSSPGQVIEHTESKRRQYGLADAARTTGFVPVTVIDDDLGRSGSGLVERPGFQKLVAAICGGSIGAVYCIEASRLARNGRDWHHLIDLCALVGTLVIDPDGAYDPRLMNDRLLLGLKGTMSEYELSLLRQRGLAARDSKAKRGELRFALPPGFCWDELGRIEIAWQAARYHTVLQILRHPLYAGAYVFGRTGQRTQVVEGRARKTNGHDKPMPAWNVLLKDHHPGYISWTEFEENQQMISENAHMQKRMSRKSARGGRALLTGMVRCGRCGRMMRVFYGARSGHAHRYQCPGDSALAGLTFCIGIGGVRVDQAVAAALVEAVSDHAVEAAIRAAEQIVRTDEELRLAVTRELEEARYEASLAARRYEAVDPTKRLVARELEARWNISLERVAQLEERLKGFDDAIAKRPSIDRAALMTLAQDLPSVWNAPGTDPRTKQRLARILIQEAVIDLDKKSNEAVVTVHWAGGRHTEIRVLRTKTGRYPENLKPSAVVVMRKLGGQWSDRQLAVTMNRMRCKTTDGKSWTMVRVRELRERLGIAVYDPSASNTEMISADEAARRLKICVGSVHLLIRERILPATQLMHSAPWQVPASALETKAVKIGVQKIVARRPRNAAVYQEERSLKLPGF